MLVQSALSMLGVGVRVTHDVHDADPARSSSARHVLSCMSSCSQILALGRSLGTRLLGTRLLHSLNSSTAKRQLRQLRSATATLIKAVSAGVMHIFTMDVFEAGSRLSCVPAMTELWTCGIKACGLTEGDASPILTQGRLSHAGAFLDLVAATVAKNTVADRAADVLGRRILCDCTVVLAHLQQCKQVRHCVNTIV